MNKPGIVAVMAFVTALSASATAWADPLPLVAGNQLQALKKTTVRMLKEDLSIELTENTLKVRATFLFKNNGPSISLPVGFPCGQPDYEIAGMNCKSDLHVSLRGRRKVPPLKTVAKYGTCWVWDMEFGAQEEVRLDIDYSAPIVNDRYSIPLGGIYFVYYPLRTGANWDGAIGELAIHVRTPAETIVQITPKGFTRAPGLIEWRMKDAEPVQDLFVVFDPPSTGAYLWHMSERRTAPDQSAPDAWLEKFAREFLQGLDRRLGALYQLWELAKDAPNYTRFMLPGTEGSVAVIESSARVMDEIARKKSE